eukprot:GCRY01002602.1.p1 GENE.GCRY01002602.1~~GCRY01002602.1.p1  ORF type:complete len:875 (+),score=340.84 GCRY01002602.1:317-2941(+)
MSIVVKIQFPQGEFDALYKFFKIDTEKTVNNAIEHIAKKMNISDTSDFCLFIPPSASRYTICMEDNKLVKEYDVREQDILQFKHKLSALTIVLLDGSKRAVELDLTIKLCNLLPMIMRHFKIPFKKVSLTHQGQFLSSSLSLGEQGVNKGAVLTITVTPEAAKGDGLPKVSAKEIKEKALKHGLLCKLVERTNKWGNPKWFALYDNFIYYYRSEKDDKPRSVIPLQEYTAREITLKNPHGKHFIFEVFLTQSTAANVRASYVLAADSAAEMTDWMHTIQKTHEECLLARERLRVFGVGLDRVAKEPDTLVPAIFRHCLLSLRDHLKVEGIFRISGAASEIYKLKDRFDHGEVPDLRSVANSDPHVVSGLLKLYLRELPEPLLTFDAYDDFVMTTSLPFIDDKRHRFKKLIEPLPDTNKAVLKELIDFLRLVDEHRDVNKMAIHNLATVFAPNLLRRENETVVDQVQDIPFVNDVLSIFIKDFVYIFGDEPIPLVYPDTPRPPTAIRLVKALYDYSAADENELSFYQYDRFYVVAMGDDDWWEGVNPDGSHGLFPSNYVDVLEEYEPTVSPEAVPPEESPAPPVDENAEAVLETPMSPEEKKKNRRKKIKEEMAAMRHQLAEESALRLSAEQQNMELENRLQQCETALAEQRSHSEELKAKIDGMETHLQRAIALQLTLDRLNQNVQGHFDDLSYMQFQLGEGSSPSLPHPCEHIDEDKARQDSRLLGELAEYNRVSLLPSLENLVRGLKETSTALREITDHCNIDDSAEYDGQEEEAMRAYRREQEKQQRRLERMSFMSHEPLVFDEEKDEDEEEEEEEEPDEAPMDVSELDRERVEGEEGEEGEEAVESEEEEEEEPEDDDSDEEEDDEEDKD